MLHLRIDGHTTFLGERIQKSAGEAKNIDSFAHAMKKTQAKHQLDSLKGLLDRVDLHGQKLAKQRTLENLIAYKNTVKQFVSESLSYGLQLTDKESFHPNGGMKAHQLVEIIDEKLLEIQDEVLSSEKDGLETLELVGEIKGLLINLYM
ncbi:YaaR family protein [Planococcus chinensis]|uniref:YaaR family protein n=1 Tax=Planococcus chinensis TaxID=272917 RepID=A0ABW4QES3_9BACL